MAQGSPFSLTDMKVSGKFSHVALMLSLSWNVRVRALWELGSGPGPASCSCVESWYALKLVYWCIRRSQMDRQSTVNKTGLQPNASRYWYTKYEVCFVKMRYILFKLMQILWTIKHMASAIEVWDKHFQRISIVYCQYSVAMCKAQLTQKSL